MQPSIRLVVCVVVWPAATDDASAPRRSERAAFTKRRAWLNFRVARVRASNVRADRTTVALPVFVLIEKVVAVFEALIIFSGAKRQRSATAPAAD